MQTFWQFSRGLHIFSFFSELKGGSPLQVSSPPLDNKACLFDGVRWTNVGVCTDRQVVGGTIGTAVSKILQDLSLPFGVRHLVVDPFFVFDELTEDQLTLCTRARLLIEDAWARRGKYLQ